MVEHAQRCAALRIPESAAERLTVFVIDVDEPACNGIGAEWMWDNLRDMLGAFNPTLTLAADIHDMRYEIGGNDADREFADDEFLENAIICADAEYCWFNPLRYHVRKQARKFYFILRIAGGKAWEDAQEKGGG